METQVEISEPKPHVAFFPSPGMGHTIPLLELAIRLVTQHNFQVSFLVTNSSLAQNEYLNNNQHPDLYIVHLPPPDDMSILNKNTPFFTRLCVIAHESIRPLWSVLSGLRKPNFKALIIDMFCTGVFDVCKELSIPVYTFFTASTVFLSFCLYFPTMDEEVKGEVGDLRDPIKIPGCEYPILIQDIVDQVRNRKSDDYKWLLFHVSRLSMAKAIFVNTWDDLEPNYLNAFKHEQFFENIPLPPVYPIGPLTKSDDSVLDDQKKEIMTWLDNQPKDSVLFVALGSGGTLTSEQLIELAYGLELSRQRFILVVRRPNNDVASEYFSMGSNLDDPREYLPDGFVQRTNPFGLVVGAWAPQVGVLKHPSTGAFLSHCGWNSTLESVKHGVPMIAWPMYAEQRMNATMLCNEVGVAVKMPVVGETSETLLVGRYEIERVVRMIMEGDEGKKLRTRAKELEASTKVALSRDGSSYETLAQVAESWKLDGRVVTELNGNEGWS